MKNERLQPIVEKVIAEFLRNSGPKMTEIFEQTANAVALLVASHVRMGLEEYLDAKDHQDELQFLADVTSKAKNLLAEFDDPIAGQDRLMQDVRAFLSAIANRNF